MPSYNLKMHDIYDAYNSGKSLEEIEKEFGAKIVITDTELCEEVINAYANDSLVMDFAPDGEIIGKIIYDDKLDSFNTEKSYFKKRMLVIWSVALIFGYLLMLLVYLFLIRPVREFSKFSNEISKGNLDVKLPIHRGNMFDTFTESFDQMREELKASKEREIEAEKAKKEIMAELSHDINTPVASIQATCEVLDMQLSRREKNSENDDFREKVGMISSKTETISKIMENVLHSTMDELDKIEINVREESSVIIESYFRNLQNYGNIIMENHIPECLVNIDRLRMEQVIDNVVGNSHKYAGTDIHVSFSEVLDIIKNSKEKCEYIKIRIKDDGPGVSEKDLPLITDKYYRSEAAKNKKGYGLGMYLVDMYMKKQGGGIEYYNDNGFVVELLVRKAG
ncbi:MAG: HAMP domain-containing histidine kinase [Eubacterium sp.]|nr:HAMP domain-containing histidine kinase [Eubacterium sp.]